VDPEMNIALEGPKFATRLLEDTKLVFKIYLSGSGNEQYISWTEISFITLSKAILSFLEYDRCGSRNGHCIICTKISFIPNIKNKTS